MQTPMLALLLKKIFFTLSDIKRGRSASVPGRKDFFPEDTVANYSKSWVDGADEVSDSGMILVVMKEHKRGKTYLYMQLRYEQGIEQGDEV